MAELAQKRAAFRALQRQGCFALHNPRDLGSLHRLERLSFRAVASTSACYAGSLGFNDGALSCNLVLDHLRRLCSATDLPVNADLEDRFAQVPEEVATNVVLAVDNCIAGLSIEERNEDTLYDLTLPTSGSPLLVRQSTDAIRR